MQQVIKATSIAKACQEASKSGITYHSHKMTAEKHDIQGNGFVYQEWTCTFTPKRSLGSLAVLL